MSEEADENSRDGSWIRGRVPAIFVPSSQKALCADEIISRLRENPNLELWEEEDVCMVNLDWAKSKTRSKNILTEEDAFDIFFLPQLLEAFAGDLGASKSMIELFKEAESNAEKHFGGRRKNKAYSFIQIWQHANDNHDHRMSQRSESQQSYSQGEDSNVDDQEFQFSKKQFLRLRFEMVKESCKKARNVKFEDFEIDPSNLSTISSKVFESEFGAETHRVRIIRINRGRTETYGYLLMFRKEDKQHINEYRKKIEEEEEKEEEKEEEETKKERPVIVQLSLRDHENKYVSHIAVEYKRYDKIKVDRDTFKNTATLPETQKTLTLIKFNDETCEIQLKSDCTIDEIIKEYKSGLADDVLDISLEIRVKCDMIGIHADTPTDIRLPKIVQDAYDNIYPEQKRVAQRLLERVKCVMSSPGHGGNSEGGLQAFHGIHFLVLVPTFKTLKSQTEKRIEDCLYPVSPPWKNHVMTYDNSNLSKFKKFKEAVLEKPKSIFVLIADESHWGYNKDGAHDKFVNDADLLEATNLVIIQVSATPYCNLTRHSRVPEKYIEDTSQPSWKIMSAEEKSQDSEELHIVNWYPSTVNGTESSSENSKYLRLEYFLRSIPSFERHYYNPSNGTFDVDRPLSSQYIRKDAWFELLRKSINRKSERLQPQSEHLWLADMIMSLVYFRYYRWNALQFELFSLEESRERVLYPSGDDSVGDQKMWWDSGDDSLSKKIFDSKLAEDDGESNEMRTLKESDELRILQETTVLFHKRPADSAKSPCVEEFLDRYREMCKDESFPELKEASERVISGVLSEVGRIVFEDETHFQKQNLPEGEKSAFSIFLYGKLDLENCKNRDSELSVTESDRMVLNLLEAKWEVRERGHSQSNETKKKVWCVSGPMKIVRVMSTVHGEMVSDVLKKCCLHLFSELSSQPKQSMLSVLPSFPPTPFAVIRDFGHPDAMWCNLDDHFRTVHLIRKGIDDLSKLHDFVLKKDDSSDLNAKQLEYGHLEGLPCILILVEKGRMGDTFPHSFNCLDLRIRTSENTTTFVQEIGRLCRYPSTLPIPGLSNDKEKCFSKWDEVEVHLFKEKRDPFEGGSKVLAVSYFAAEDKQLFLGYATHKMPWEERANGRILFKGEPYTVETCEYSESNNKTTLTVAATLPDRLVGCRMAPVVLTKFMVDKGIKNREFFNIIAYEQGSHTFTLEGDCTQHFEISNSSVVVVRDESCLKWLVDEALKKCPLDKPKCIIEEVAYSFPHALVTNTIMDKLEKAVKQADNHFPLHIWECIKLKDLDKYVSPVKSKQQAKDLITTDKSLIHEYRTTYNGNKGSQRDQKFTNANADAYEGEDYVHKGRSVVLKNVHLRRFVLSAETQIGKTGAYCWFLKLLADEIRGDELPIISDKAQSFDKQLSMADKVKWMLPYWDDISRKQCPWKLKVKRGKYHCKVKLQRFCLLLKVLRSDRDDTTWRPELISRLRGRKDDGECVLTEFHSQRLDDLAEYLKPLKKPLIVDAEEAFSLNGDDSKKVLEKIIDWDCVDMDTESSFYWSSSSKEEKSDLLDSRCIMKMDKDRYVMDKKEITNVQRLSFETRKSRKVMDPAAGKPHQHHPYRAIVTAHPSSAGSEVKYLRPDGCTKIKRTDVQWFAPEAKTGITSLFGTSSQGPKLSIPSTSKNAFTYDNEDRIMSVSEVGRARFWIFTASYRRHLGGGAPALLERSKALENLQDFVQVLVVRRDEFEYYRSDFGKTYVVIGMPESMILNGILEATTSKQLKYYRKMYGDEMSGSNSTIEVSHDGGVGYSRLFVQIFSRLMELPTIWMLDDNVQACYYIDIDEMFKDGQQILLSPPKPCTFAHIIRIISAQFYGGGNISRDPDERTSVPAHSPGQELEHLMNGWDKAKKMPLVPCPKTSDNRQTPRFSRPEKLPISFEKRSTWESKDIGSFSGKRKEFAVVGMSRDPPSFATRLKNIEQPFKVTHSVYSFYLLNVESTVDNGVFYPPKTFQEDIHFNQLCEESDLAVLKFRHFFHHKKNLQNQNASQETGSGVVRAPAADAPTNKEQQDNAEGAAGDAPSNAVGLEQSGGESTSAAAQVLPHVSAGEGDGAAAASASVSASDKRVLGAGTASSGETGRGDGAFSSELLADVLCAALPTKVAMRDLVQAVKAKRKEAFKSVQLSSKADGPYSNTQIAERIAECKPDQVTDAEGLLSWLIKENKTELKKSHLEDAMDSVGLKHVTRDTVDELCRKITTSWPRTRRGILSETGAKRLPTADAPDTQEQKKSKTEGVVGDAPSNAVGLEQSGVESTGTAAQVLPHISAGEGDGEAAASASASASDKRVLGAGTASSGEAARGNGSFSSQLLADVLCAALPTKVAMRDFVQAVKAKSEAFKSVQLSSKADGPYSNTQIAERIAECKPDQVTDAEGLLSWLIKTNALKLLEKAQEKLLKKSHLEDAMDSVGLKHVTRDTVDQLCLKITTTWPRTRRGILSETGAKRNQSADAPDTLEQKTSRTGGAVDDALSNALVVDGESETKGAKGSVDTSAPRHMQSKVFVSSGEGGSALSALSSFSAAISAGAAALSAGASAALSVFSPRREILSPETGVKRALQADAPANQAQKRSKTEGAVDDAPSNAVGLKHSDSETTGTAAQVLPHVSGAGGDGAAAAASASASASEEAGSEAGTASSGEAARGNGSFSSQLLADVLCAALPTKVAMRDFVQAVKAKSEAFKSVQLSSKADGPYSNTQIAERIAECKPDQVTDAEGLLSWFIKTNALKLLEKAQEKLLKKSHLEDAMDSVGLKHVTRDTVDQLCLKITTTWPRTRRGIPSETGAKRNQSADAPDTLEQKTSRTGGAVDDALSNALVVDGESETEGEGAESSVDDAAPCHIQAKASVSSGGGGSAAIAALSGAREERIGDKRKLGGEELSVPNDGKTRKTGPEHTESGADGEGLEDVTEEVPVSLHVPELMAMQDVGGGGATLEYQDVGGGGATLDYYALDQTIWAHLEFEDGQKVPLKNSVSTSFYIGREPSVNEHHHQFLHEADNVWRRVSAKHCHILRLDTAGSATLLDTSMNGTWINDERLLKNSQLFQCSKQLRDGDKVKLYALATGEPTLPCAIFTFRLEEGGRSETKGGGGGGRGVSEESAAGGERGGGSNAAIRVDGSSYIRRRFSSDVDICVHFHSSQRKSRLGPRLKIEELPSAHKHYKSANTFADIHGPIFHFQVEGDKLESEVDVCFEIPMSGGISEASALSLVLLRLPAEGGDWEVTNRNSCSIFCADGKVFLNITTLSFSWFTWGTLRDCCVRAAFHCFRRVSQRIFKVIIFSSEVKFPFPREDGGTMKLDGFGIVTPTDGDSQEVRLKDNEQFKIGFSFQRHCDDSDILFDLDLEKLDRTNPERNGLATFQQHHIFTPTISNEDLDRHKDRHLHVWMARRRNGEGWEKTYLGSFPLAKVNEGNEWPSNINFSYFPLDPGKEGTCCFFGREDKCTNFISNSTSLSLQRLLTSSKLTYCRFCGISLCQLHPRSRFKSCFIGDLCRKHTTELDFCQNVNSIAQSSSKGKVAPALAEPQGKIEGKRFAFTLGNRNYLHFGNLQVCSSDVHSMQQELEKLSFKVQKQEDATKPIFEQKIHEWVEMIKFESQQSPCIALFHASCHGVEVDKENYLVPIEAETSGLKSTVTERCISLQALLDLLTLELPAGSLILFFLDCCRDEPTDEPTKSLNLNAPLDIKFAKLKLADGRRTTTFVGYATEPGKTAATRAFGSAGLSPFTHAILECLKHPKIACEDIDVWFRHVRALVMHMTSGGMIPDSQHNLTKGFVFKSEQA